MPISTKLGMLHRRLQPIIVCTNYGPGVTLTYVTAMSNLVTYAFSMGTSEKVDFSENIAACDLKHTEKCKSSHLPV